VRVRMPPRAIAPNPRARWLERRSRRREHLLQLQGRGQSKRPGPRPGPSRHLHHRC